MINAFENAPWHQISDTLMSGSPPIIVLMLGLNTLVFCFFVARRVKGVPALRDKAALQVEILLIIANVLVLFQSQIKDLLGQVI